ncbi:outer membrane beta-barrel protein [Flagellimonas onchidii]|uniref:outer membrane beta-barrel protein n=1 Tax=Flagellimonas onchidii TaxID=2562684 RepID=UPI0010A5CAB9|nr:outer membrane beta-barrel protein [Allomuricauda onchidii]
MGKKSLEQLFKEVFKDFKETPDDNVWKAIEASLDKKEQKKRVIPIWWKLGGAAAVLTLLFLVINPFDSSKENDNVIITESQNNNDSATDNETIKQIEDSEQLVNSSNDDEGDSNENRAQGTEESTIQEQNSYPDQQLTSTANEERGNNTVAEANKVQDKLWKDNNAEEQAIASSNSEKQPVTEAKNEGLDAINNETISVVVSNDEVSEQSPATGTDQNKNVSQNPELFDSSQEKNAIAENSENVQRDKEEVVAQNQERENTPEKKSIFEVIEEQEEEAVAKNGTSSKWSVGPSVAPVYSSASGNGSPIHSIFSSNSKSGNVNLSYGLTVAYNVTKKLKVRSGVHKVDYGYDTNNVIFSSSLDAATSSKIDNIDYRQASRTIVVQSQENIPQPSANDALVEFAANENPSFEGKMIQQLGYIEVPVELDYALIDKKFGVNIIGGVSSLFLVDNSVLLESEDRVTEVGEANNANDLNFSTNIGVGLNYEFSPKVQLNLEPVFKYQLNTFSETAGSFRPFSVGVYSGVRFKF